MKNHRTLGGALALTIVLAACGGDDIAEPVADALTETTARSNAAPAPDEALLEYGLVSPAVAVGLAADDRVTVIDVRTPDEFAEGHLADADLLIDFHTDTFAAEIAALDRSGEYLLYCRSGNRSGQTAALMEQLGFGQVYDLQGGVNAWSADGLALVAS